MRLIFMDVPVYSSWINIVVYVYDQSSINIYTSTDLRIALKPGNSVQLCSAKLNDSNAYFKNEQLLHSGFAPQPSTSAKWYTSM